jgi:hypothetical protein
MLWVCIHTLPGSQNIQSDAGAAKCRQYFNHAVLLKKVINMDLIYKTSAVLLVEKKGKDIPEYSIIHILGPSATPWMHLSLRLIVQPSNIHSAQIQQPCAFYEEAKVSY